MFASRCQLLATHQQVVHSSACPCKPTMQESVFENRRHLRRVAGWKSYEAKASCVLQELRGQASQYALPADAQRNVAANGSVPAYTLFPHADLQGTPGMQCSSGDQLTTDAITSCASSRSGTCCVNYDNLQLSSTARVRHFGLQLCCTSVIQALSSTFQLHIHSKLD